MIPSATQALIYEAGKNMNTVLINYTDNSPDIESDIWKELGPCFFKEDEHMTVLYAVDVRTHEFVGLNIRYINDVIVTSNIFSAEGAWKALNVYSFDFNLPL